jgi:hypothetical protein
VFLILLREKSGAAPPSVEGGDAPSKRGKENVDTLEKRPDFDYRASLVVR